MNLEDTIIAVSLALGKTNGQVIIEKASTTVYHEIQLTDDQSEYISRMVQSFIEQLYGCSLEEFIRDFFDDH